ncbi:ACP S-malonyltransferase [Lysinibacillus xylanilyticus]|uniref:[acyl-carrier-protein] S-malonyltransferase n=1 Tax=Lysinibacillus xylanilyticus TaxID=582475 RepID=A0ABT4EV96_9BACI|nr:ACP S-malonyltransferase [Lysinibacillus xylanilyticus]MCY9549595.1 ACP S-malonyltransferase [Lysinibacillus xylanilyticus]
MIAYIFPGQGSQYVGMGNALIDKYSIAKETFEQANEALGFDLSSLMLEGNLNTLTQTENAQPALLTLSTAVYRVLQKEFNITPHYLLGHSLGEYSALCAGGVLTFEDALKIVRKRGLLMQEAVKNGLGVMTAVANIAASRVEEACKEVTTPEYPVSIGCFNGPNQVVISGHQQSVKKVEDLLSKDEAILTPLKVSASFHSPLMADAANKLEEFLFNFNFARSDVPIISNVTGKPHVDDPKEYITLLKRQMVEPVMWETSIRYIQQKGVKHTVELGSKSVLTNLMRSITKDISSIPFEKPEDVSNFKGMITRYLPPAFLDKSLAIAVATKNQNWDEEEYQKGVVEPYKKVKKLSEAVQKEDREATVEEMLAAIEMLQSVFKTKKVQEQEQNQKINELLKVTKTEHLLKAHIS